MEDDGGAGPGVGGKWGIGRRGVGVGAGNGRERGEGEDRK